VERGRDQSWNRLGRVHGEEAKALELDARFLFEFAQRRGFEVHVPGLATAPGDGPAANARGRLVIAALLKKDAAGCIEEHNAAAGRAASGKTLVHVASIAQGGR
jgi:hypothetical protein